MHSTIWKIFAIGCAVAIKLPTQNKTKQKIRKKVLQTKQNETKQNKRQAAVISNHNNCSERSNKKTNQETERESKKGRETAEERRC